MGMGMGMGMEAKSQKVENCKRDLRKNPELAQSYERIKQVQIAHRPLLAAAGKLDQIEEELDQKLVTAEQNIEFDKQLTAMEHIKDAFKIECRDQNAMYMSKNRYFMKILARS